MVVLKRIEEYNYELVKQNILDSLNEFNFLDKINSNTNVFIKLNCVGPFKEDMGITTHPVVLDAVLSIIKTKTDKIVVGDNPAVRDITFTLKKCGLYDCIIKHNATIITGDDFTTIHNSNAKTYSTFEVSRQMVECDCLINLPKIKTHTLAYMTCALKNFFGLIYGLNKSAWHTKASNPLEFGNAINDLYGAFLESMKDKPIIHICDGIIGLEGEGPSTGGKAKKANAIITSTDAVSADRVALELVKLDYSKLYITQIANERGYGESDLDKIEIKGNSLSDFEDVKFDPPKDSLSSFGLRIMKHKIFRNILLEHPKIDKEKCIKCGECAKICPEKTMQIKPKENPNLKPINCIRCWCCAEVCPKNAIHKSKRPIFGKIFLK